MATNTIDPKHNASQIFAEEKQQVFHDEQPVDGMLAHSSDPEFIAYISSLSPEEFAAQERALVRKIDKRLIPVVFVMMGESICTEKVLADLV